MDFELRTNPPPGLMPLQAYSFAWKRFRRVTVARKSSNGQKEGATDYWVVMTCSAEQKGVEQHYDWPYK